MKSNVILDFIAEAGKLKQVKRSGWWMVGIPNEESVAEHSFRAAVIGYVLAKMENADVSKVLAMTLFNDLHEARINDLHKVAHRYLDVRTAEKKAFEEQISGLDKTMRQELQSIRKEHDTQKTVESIISRDADILECLIQAKEYVDAGYNNAKKFFKEGPKHLKTKSAKKLWQNTKVWNSNSWWEKLGVFER
ncbi:MAG: HD domain-containing protein [Candidatus Omnitrophica bacterium]|nr:HD domain-containing protein [Candidatus Omnitrophota bacterium]MBU1894411.1 HD domain-containing protein [Candidatus Omnitrophota bacterium]